MRVLIFLLLLCTVVSAQIVNLSPAKQSFQANEIITVDTNLVIDKAGEEEWDTYLVFNATGTPAYITIDGNSLTAEPLGMLPPQIHLQADNWHNPAKVTLTVYLCKTNTQKVFAKSKTTFTITSGWSEKSSLPAAPQLLLIQELDERTNPQDRYTDYKQFDSRWKYEKMGQYNGTTIGKSGCAMTAAGNIIGRDPSSLNSTLQSNGGYSGNLLIWSKVPGLSYKGSGSISDSLFSSYHVIANVGGHFVLLTYAKSSGNYYSKDPGKSSNPVYSKSQVYSVRLYYK